MKHLRPVLIKAFTWFGILFVLLSLIGVWLPDIGGWAVLPCVVAATGGCIFLFEGLGRKWASPEPQGDKDKAGAGDSQP
ncbi:MAG: hypothetical protein FD180_4347 [Planctomycetota bacterium]|nr:MAG: hypothetical protein FD180_4347 [Planctomycetota bacterium]